MNTPVIGFLAFSDFLEELKSQPLWGEPVRVQDYYESTHVKSLAPLEWLTFFVEIAIHTNNAILVCRFLTSRIQVFARDEQEKVKRYTRRNKRAAQIVRSRLEREGFKIRPGLVAGAADSKTEASPDGLWSTWQELDDDPQPEAPQPANAEPLAQNS